MNNPAEGGVENRIKDRTCPNFTSRAAYLTHHGGILLRIFIPIAVSMMIMQAYDYAVNRKQDSYARISKIK